MKTHRVNRPAKTAASLTLAAVLATGANFSLAPMRAVAQPQPDNAKAVNPPNRKKGERGARKGNGLGKKMVAREMARIERANGKPLTEEQKTQVQEALTERVKATRAAQEDYLKAVAGATGITVDELQMKMRAQRRRAAQRDAAPNGAAPAPNRAGG